MGEIYFRHRGLLTQRCQQQCCSMNLGITFDTDFITHKPQIKKDDAYADYNYSWGIHFIKTG